LCELPTPCSIPAKATRAPKADTTMGLHSASSQHSDHYHLLLATASDAMTDSLSLLAPIPGPNLRVRGFRPSPRVLCQQANGQ